MHTRHACIQTYTQKHTYTQTWMYREAAAQCIFAASYDVPCTTSPHKPAPGSYTHTYTHTHFERQQAHIPSNIRAAREGRQHGTRTQKRTCTLRLSDTSRGPAQHKHISTQHKHISTQHMHMSVAGAAAAQLVRMQYLSAAAVACSCTM